MIAVAIASLATLAFPPSAIAQDRSADINRVIPSPSGAEGQRTRPRAVIREVARRVPMVEGELALPAVTYHGVPVILNVPGVGYVDVPEDEYARLYDKLSSQNSEQIEAAMTSLRQIKAAEDAEVEAAWHRPNDPLLFDASRSFGDRDLSTPVRFGSRYSIEGSRRHGRRGQGLY
jgi:hypothetical protein